MGGLAKVAGIVRLIAIIVAIVGAFIAIPMEAAILVVLGIISALGTPLDQRMGVSIAALALIFLSDQLDAIPAIGTYLGDITGNIGIAASGAALMGILLTLYSRITDGLKS